MRLDSFLTQYGFAARRDARQFCRFNDVEQHADDGAAERMSVATATNDEATLRGAGRVTRDADDTNTLALGAKEPLDSTAATNAARHSARSATAAAASPPPAPTRIVSGATKVHPSRVTVNGERPPYAGVPLHLVLHKPRGVVCTRAEGEGRTVLDLLPPAFARREPPLCTVGRLDKGASGLLLLTQSGALNERLASPRSGCAKSYVVALAAPLRGHEAGAFAAGGLELVDGHRCAPAELTPHRTQPHLCRVALHEGRYHQLRRMFAALGHTVTGIHRAAYGGLSLAATGLPEGQWRLLSEAELRTVLESSRAVESTAAGGDRRAASAIDVAGDHGVVGRRKLVRTRGAAQEEEGGGGSEDGGDGDDSGDGGGRRQQLQHQLK